MSKTLIIPVTPEGLRYFRPNQKELIGVYPFQGKDQTASITVYRFNDPTLGPFFLADGRVFNANSPMEVVSTVSCGYIPQHEVPKKDAIARILGFHLGLLTMSCLSEKDQINLPQPKSL